MTPISQTDGWRDDINQQLGRIETNVELIHHAVLGNGQAGLIQRVGALEAAENQRLGRQAFTATFFGTIAGVITSWLHRHLFP